MLKEPTTTCRVFISRNSRDREVSQRIRSQLEGEAGNLEFFDDGDIKPGERWLERLREELKQTNLLLLVLTEPSRDDFDWPLYEAGLFESLDEEDRQRVVCIYPDPKVATPNAPEGKVGVPRQLADRQGVEASEEGLLKLLLRLFHDEHFTNTVVPLHKRISDAKLRPIARLIADAINGVRGPERLQLHYTNPYIQLILPSGADTLERGTDIGSDQVSLKTLFGLDPKPPGAHWTWGEILTSLPRDGDPGGFNRRWALQLEEAIAAMRAEKIVEQLTGRFLARDGKLYRPEIEIYRKYDSGRMTVDVSFSEQVQDSWLREARAPVALAANLALASRIRHELIEPCLRRLAGWNSDSAIVRECSRLSQLVEAIEHDGFFIKRLTRNQLSEAFDREEAKKLGKLDAQYRKEIKPLIDDAKRNHDVVKMLPALELWEQNNLSFLDIGLNCYIRMLGLSKGLEPHGSQKASTHEALRPN